MTLVTSFVCFLHEARERLLYLSCYSNSPLLFAASCVLVFYSLSLPLTVFGHGPAVSLWLCFLDLHLENRTLTSLRFPEPSSRNEMFFKRVSLTLGSQPTGNRHWSSCLISHSGTNTEYLNTENWIWPSYSLSQWER